MVNDFEDPPESVEVSGVGLTLLFGALLLVTPVIVHAFIRTLDATAWANALVAGLAVIGLALVTRAAATHGRLDRASWSAGASALVGAWILVSPFVLNEGGLYLWSLVASGLLIAFTAGYSAWLAWNTPRPAARRSRA